MIIENVLKAALFALIITPVACLGFAFYDYNNPVLIGVVVEKHRVAPWVQYVQSGDIMVPIFYDEEWRVGVKGETAKHETRTQSIKVSRDIYQTIRIGQLYQQGQFK